MIEAFVKYLEFQKRVSAHTVIAYHEDLCQLNKFLKENELNEIESVNYSELRMWMTHLVELKLTPRSINRKIASVRTFFKFILREGIREDDPTQKIVVLKSPKRLPHFVKEGEISTVLDQPLTAFSDDLDGQRIRCILEMFYATGMRLSELINLKDNSIDFHARTVRVLGKRNKERVIPFGKNLVSIIKEYISVRDREVMSREKNFFFVTNSGKRCYPMMVYRLVKKYLSENTRVEKSSPHVLRHTFATHLLNEGADLNAVKELLGHANLAATQVYTHNTMEKLKKVFDQAHPKA